MAAKRKADESDVSAKRQKQEEVVAAVAAEGRKIELSNKLLRQWEKEGKADFLYHLGLNSSQPLQKMFGDVKFVLMGGSPVRAQSLAERLARELPGFEFPVGAGVVPIGKTERYSIYKVGHVLSISHGIGMASMSVALHELAKLLHYAKATDVRFMRLGTSGGLGVEPGTIVVATDAFNGVLKPEFNLAVLGEMKSFPTHLDDDLGQAIFECAGDGIKAVRGVTMGTHCFYEGQGRLDGAMCDYTEQDKFDFLKKAHAAGVRNIEMESTFFASFCKRAGIPGALCCVALVDRLNGDQVTATPEELAGFSNNTVSLVLRYIKKHYDE